MSKKLKELKEWAAKNVTLVKLLPPNDNLEVTTRLIDVLEDEVDEKYYLSEEKTKKLTLDNDLGGKLNMYDYNERDRVHSVNKVSPTLNTMQGGDRQPKIAVKGFKEIVKVRKYDVNKLELSELLRISKQDVGISNKEISNTLNVPITKVEHWFRSDKSFSIPDAEIWLELKTLLNITNTEHDEAVTTFEEKESEFDTTNRIYDTEYLSPTLNTTSEPKVAVIGNTSNTGHKSHDVHDTDGLSPTVAARDYKGPKQIAVPVLTPDRVNKRQNGRRCKDDGEPMFTLTAQDRHGIAIREATKKGYAIAEQGDSVNVTYPDSKTRRGRVGKQVAQTIQTGEVNQGVVIDDTQGYDGVRYYKGIAPTLRSSRSGLKTIVAPKEESGEVNQGGVMEDKNIRFTDDGFHTHRNDKKKSSIQGTHVTYKEGETHALTSNHVPMTLNNLRIRKLTPLECWRLQGFTDEQFYKAKDSGVSNSQLYKQAGNSVTVPVVDAIVKQLKE